MFNFLFMRPCNTWYHDLLIIYCDIDKFHNKTFAPNFAFSSLIHMCMCKIGSNTKKVLLFSIFLHLERTGSALCNCLYTARIPEIGKYKNVFKHILHIVCLVFVEPSQFAGNIYKTFYMKPLPDYGPETFKYVKLNLVTSCESSS